MSIIARRRDRNLALDKSAWFLCRFLCRSLNEDNYEKIRDHVSTCKGVKTRLKLSERGVEIGYKPNHVRHYHHKIKYEILPLATTESMVQDIVFINVLLCVFHIQNLPDLEYEIIAFKFLDSNIVKRYQDVCNILLGGMSQMRAYDAPGKSGNITLMPSKAYHMGALAPEKWGSVGTMSEVSYGRSGRGIYGYGAIVPGNEVQRRGIGVSNRQYQYDGNDEGNDAISFASSGGDTFREVAVSANLDRTPTSPKARPILDFNRSKTYTYEGHTVGDASCQAAVEDDEGRWTGGSSGGAGYPNYMRAESGSVVSAQSSGVFDDETGHVLHSNGVTMTYSSNRPRQNNITLKSMDVTDGGRHDQRGYNGNDRGMTSSVRRIFKKKQQDGPPVITNDGRNDMNYLKTRSQSMDQFHSSSRSDIYHPAADAMSVRSQASYYLVPSFKKVYAKRNGQAMSPENSLYHDNRSRLYSGSVIRGN